MSKEIKNRVIIREPKGDDKEAFLRAMISSQSLHCPWVKSPLTSKEFDDYLLRGQQSNQKCFLVCNPSNDIVGVFNINEIVRGFFQNAYLGFYAVNDYSGQGYMSAGLKLVLRYVFEEMKLHRLEANIQPENTRSIQLVKSNGFHYEGFSPRYLKINDEWCGHEHWVITAEDFIAGSPTVLKKYQGQAEDSELGKKADYDQSYNPDRLYPIPRAGKRKEIGIDPNNLPFSGFDCWNHYEVSWLNEKGKPIVATAEIYYDCASSFIIESKSLKLYFNSFNNSKFKTINEVEKTIQNDLEKAIDSEVTVIINQLGHAKLALIHEKFEGECIDNLDIECTKYTVDPSFLSTSNELVNETLYSDLLKSNCLVTNQPDWGSVQISYTGNKINREGLLQYLVSFRNHNEFHEQCIERIFVDIMAYCKPRELTIYGRYTRRGGLDINPYRSTKKVNFKNLNYRLIRQ